MDCVKTGRLLKELRLSKGYTQVDVALRLNISGRAVSKRERGSGCPVVSLLPELAEADFSSAARSTGFGSENKSFKTKKGLKLNPRGAASALL